MSASDDKKTKRKKNKRSSVVKSAKTQNLSQPTCQNIPNPSIDFSTPPPGDIAFDTETLQKLMDARDDSELPQILSFTRGPNPYIDKERCLLCGCERMDPPEAASIKSQSTEKSNSDLHSLDQLPLWVCRDCRKSTDQGMEKKVDIASFMEQDLPPEPATLPFLSENSDIPSSTVCNCEACTERREIEAEHDRETQELQTCWTVLRNLVRKLYSGRGDEEQDEDIDEENLPDEEKAKELVHRLCSRDPHQLFLRLESQVREFVLEMKVRLLKQLHSGYKTPAEAKQFIAMLLDEYGHLCMVSRKMAEILTKLKTDHLSKFNVTWELHNKHLFQSIAYTEPSIQNSLHVITSQLRLGAASKESYNEDTYPNLLHRYLKFDDEMSVISVVWRDSQQLIEQYNEEQAAMKLKQKMLKEDWEFFKAQRKILEQQVTKNSKVTQSHSNSSFEAQFTETMRLMLQGSKPAPEECHCNRCNRKRCPCDECTITHMITCGIINPEALEASNNSNHVNFIHDPNRYRIDVSPPSMSSTTSSSGSSSPIMVDPERLALPYDECLDKFENIEEIPEEIDGTNSQSDELNDDEQDDDEDDDYDEDDEDDDDDDDDEDGDEEVDCDEDDEEEERKFKESINETIEFKEPPELSSHTWLTDSDDGAAELISSETCDCYHCVSQAQAEQMVKTDESLCQCYVCLRQRGKTVSTSLPQQMPSVPTKPGEFHLYPHIHGSAGLHGLNRSHMKPLLQPQLYDLHLPMRQPKPFMPPKVPLKLDFDSPDGIHEHIYHAYGEWDNTYDACVFNLPKYGNGLGSELLPPPPLTSNFTTSFLTEPYTMATLTSVDTLSTATPTSSAFRLASSSNHSSVTTAMDDNSLLGNESPLSKVTKGSAPVTVTSSTKNMSPPCTRPATLGGNYSHQQFLQQEQALQHQKPAGPVTDKPHSQHCKRHNSLLGKSVTSSQSHSHVSSSITTTTTSTTTSSKLPVKLTQDIIETAARTIRKGANEGMQMIRQFANSLNANVNTHTCNHTASRNNGHSHPTSCSMDHNHIGSCPNSVSMPTTVNNVSVGTSTMCLEPDCDVHLDDACDSVSDSCSEQSSTTSSSNQKDGKYCDCCYCEFFGHGNPPVAPTSKNYAEMRDRLRLRLKKKQNEAKQDYHKESCGMVANHARSTPTLPPPPITTTTTVPTSNTPPVLVSEPNDPMETKGLDALIRFINGTEDQKEMGADKSISAKAAKRARQKQRKAEEKARLEEAKLQQELERLEKERERNRLNHDLEKEKNLQKKKKKKHKVKVSAESQSSAGVDLNLIRIPPAGREDEKISSAKENGLQPKEISSNSQNKMKEDISNSAKVKTKTKDRPSSPVFNHTLLSAKESSKSPAKSSNPQSLPPPVTTVIQNKPVVSSPQNTPKTSKKQQNGSVGTKPQSTASKETKVSPHGIKDDNLKIHIGENIKVTRNGKIEDTSVPTENGTRKGGKKPVQQVSVSQVFQQHPPVSLKQQGKLTGTQEQLNGGRVNNDKSLKTKHQLNHSIPSSPLLQNGTAAHKQNFNGGFPANNPKAPHQGENLKQAKNVAKQEETHQPEQNKNSSGKNKKNKKKNRNSEDLSVIDEIFMPKSESDLENGDMDEVEKELEEFKRFCLDSTPVKREKLQVNMNIKDIFVKKKSGLGCS